MIALQQPGTFETHVPLDTTIVESPAPWIQPLFNFMFDMPAWIQALGFFIGVLVAGVVAYIIWERREQWIGWLKTRSRGWKIALATVAALMLIGAVGAGLWGFNYMEHENAFCNSCHVMNESYMRFAGSEHADLGCHDCHRQSIFVSMRQLVLWVAERPEEIPPHAPVPTEICGECHLQRPDTLWLFEDTWQNVMRTAGHIIHMQSDDPDLANIECVTCHGQQVHRFIPVEATCMSAGCHDGLDIRLGRMASAPTAFHCAGCHEFTAEVSPVPHLDQLTPQRVISPDIDQCYACHEMERLLPRIAMERDPHEGACGLCHNPHTQVRVAEAVQTCGMAGCHENVEELSPFHRGLHAEVVDNCSRCHVAHEFRVDGQDCLACHRDILDDTRVRPQPAARPVTSRDVPLPVGDGEGRGPFATLPASLLRHSPHQSATFQHPAVLGAGAADPVNRKRP